MMVSTTATNASFSGIAKDQERAQHDQHIVDQRDHRRYSRRKARKDGKPDPDIHRYQYRRQNHGDHGVVERLSAPYTAGTAYVSDRAAVKPS